MTAYWLSFQIAIKFWPSWPIFQPPSGTGNRKNCIFSSYMFATLFFVIIITNHYGHYKDQYRSKINAAELFRPTGLLYTYYLSR